jgi:hypothetical protein
LRDYWRANGCGRLRKYQWLHGSYRCSLRISSAVAEDAPKTLVFCVVVEFASRGVLEDLCVGCLIDAFEFDLVDDIARFVSEVACFRRMYNPADCGVPVPDSARVVGLMQQVLTGLHSECRFSVPRRC